MADFWRCPVPRLQSAWTAHGWKKIRLSGTPKNKRKFRTDFWEKTKSVERWIRCRSLRHCRMFQKSGEKFLLLSKFKAIAKPSRINKKSISKLLMSELLWFRQTGVCTFHGYFQRLLSSEFEMEQNKIPLIPGYCCILLFFRAKKFWSNPGKTTIDTGKRVCSPLLRDSGDNNHCCDCNSVELL